MLTDRLIKEMGLLKLQPKNSNNTPSTSTSTANQPTQIGTIRKPNEPIQEPAINIKNKKNIDDFKLDKNEFRLLVKMLQAIGHECTYDNIQFDGQTVTYHHPKKTLVFNDITQADNDQTVNLSSLKDLLQNKTLKRPVWEKLKALV